MVKTPPLQTAAPLPSNAARQSKCNDFTIQLSRMVARPPKTLRVRATAVWEPCTWPMFVIPTGISSAQSTEPSKVCRIASDIAVERKWIAGLMDPVASCGSVGGLPRQGGVPVRTTGGSAAGVRQPGFGPGRLRGPRWSGDRSVDDRAPHWRHAVCHLRDPRLPEEAQRAGASVRPGERSFTGPLLLCRYWTAASDRTGARQRASCMSRGGIS
jgi:hypothetical protein